MKIPGSMERAITFDCAGDTLVGVVSLPEQAAGVGVLIVVGGPQYRAGSHRQFVMLARRLAEAGIPAMRFDCRGMGDGTGTMRTFEDFGPDIAAAIAALERACPTVERIVLWGLCDAASASLIYWRDTRDARVVGMILVNPWARSPPTLAKAKLKNYYAHRLLDKDFWSGIARGRIDVRRALRSFAGDFVAANSRRRTESDSATFQDLMAEGFGAFAGPILLLTSGQDLTASEFLEYAQSNTRWRGLLAHPNVERHEFPDADHTFSSAKWRSAVEYATEDWVRRLLPGSHRRVTLA